MLRAELPCLQFSHFVCTLEYAFIRHFIGDAALLVNALRQLYRLAENKLSARFSMDLFFADIELMSYICMYHICKCENKGIRPSFAAKIYLLLVRRFTATQQQQEKLFHKAS